MAAKFRIISAALFFSGLFTHHGCYAKPASTHQHRVAATSSNEGKQARQQKKIKL